MSWPNGFPKNEKYSTVRADIAPAMEALCWHPWPTDLEYFSFFGKTTGEMGRLMPL